MDEKLYTPFLNSVKTILKKMAGIEAELEGTPYGGSNEFTTKGVSSIIRYDGKIKGRLLLDMDENLAVVIARNITGKNFGTAKEYIVLSVVSELNNVICGDGITVLNNNCSLGLRAAVPVVFSGRKSEVCLEKIPSMWGNFTTDYGKLRINIAFEGGV